MKILYLTAAICFIVTSCKQKNNNTQYNANQQNIKQLQEKEEASYAKRPSGVGILVNTFSFEVQTKNTNSDDAIMPWISIENPANEIESLADKNEIIITENKITVVIDYPLTNEYYFNLESDKGFTRKDLIIEISKHYNQLYKEEEETASVKTLPREKRPIANRNQTNGKYGIWGHDMADLVLSEIYVYRDSNNKITVLLNIES